MMLAARVAPIIALLAYGAAPARADDGAQVARVTQALTTAAAGVNSFVLQMQVNGTNGVSGTMTFVRPMNVKSEMSIGGMTVASYLVDGMVYIHSPYAGWQKMSLDAAPGMQQSLNLGESLKTSNVILLPDRHDGGATLGVVQIDVELPAAGAFDAHGTHRLVCSYDKKTYRMSVCSNDATTMMYTKYNDPANVVALPPDAATAVLVAPAAAPSAPPAPGPPAPVASAVPAQAAPSAPPQR